MTASPRAPIAASSLGGAPAAWAKSSPATRMSSPTRKRGYFHAFRKNGRLSLSKPHHLDDPEVDGKACLHGPQVEVREYYRKEAYPGELLVVRVPPALQPEQGPARPATVDARIAVDVSPDDVPEGVTREGPCRQHKQIGRAHL